MTYGVAAAQYNTLPYVRFKDISSPNMPAAKQKTCFVIMGFGEKTDYQTGRVLDLDKSYKNVIKPAVEAAGLKCIRADEIRHSGVIDVPMYEQLLTADIVVADLSTANPNALYELGVRHALKPFTTITIAEKQLRYPFDVNHIAIRSYEHMGKDIGFDETMRMRRELKKVIVSISQKPAVDSPIYTYIKNLSPPEIMKAAESMVSESKTEATRPQDVTSDSALLDQARAAKAKSDWVGARKLFSQIRTKIKKARGQDDPYIVHQLALATYKSEKPDAVSALKDARKLLLKLNPSISHDPETLGLLGAVAKRLYLETNDMNSLDEAIASYERGFYLKNDYYNGINFAYLLNLRASVSPRNDSIADCVLARRIRSRVVEICRSIDLEKLSADDQYWVAATLEEGYFGLGDTQKYEEARSMGVNLAQGAGMRDTTEAQIRALAKLLKATPC